jgi:hypothetical protein
MVELGALMKDRYRRRFGNFEILPEEGPKLGNRSQRCLCHSVLEQAIDPWVSVFNKRQFDDSKAVIKSQNMFGLHGNV